MQPIKVGKASPTEGALPAAVYFSLKYKGDLEAALIANAGVGGDSAARGIVIGMLMGAEQGWASIPARWKNGLNARVHVEALMRDLPVRQALDAGLETGAGASDNKHGEL